MERIRELVVATGNASKAEWYKEVLSEMVQNVRGLTEEEKTKKPKETGLTAEDNARIKALFYAKEIGVLVFSEDEALYVDFLSKDAQPGVFVRRINGRDDASDSELLKYWAELVSRAPRNKRTGRWHIAYCLATPLGVYKVSSRDREVKFYYPPSLIGKEGWPLSSIQGAIEYNHPHSEYTITEKLETQNESRAAIKRSLGKLITGLKKGRKAVIYMK